MHVHIQIVSRVLVAVHYAMVVVLLHQKINSEL